MITRVLYLQYPFQQGSSGYNYSPAMQHSQTMQSLPPSGPLPPQSSWANTVPARSRGRGRLRPEELEATTGSIFRPVTPEQYSAPSSRSHTPSQEYVNRCAKSCLFLYALSYSVFTDRESRWNIINSS